MADKSLRRSSGSSLNLRNHMNDNYVIVHNVSSSVAFEKYIQFARSVFSYAVRLYNKKDYQRAYVDFTKFQRFVHEKLPSHEGYDHERYLHAKKWLLQADEAASQFLEEISFQLDILEDQKLNPDSRSVFMQEMQKHVVDIIIPEWIDSEIPHHSDGGSSRSRSTSNAHDHHLKEHSSSPSTSSVYGRSSSQSKALAYTNTHVHAHSHAGASPRATHAHHNDHPGIASDPAHLQLKPPSSQELYHHHTGQSYPHTPSSSSSSQHYSEVVHHSQQPQRAHAVPLHLAPVHAVGSHGHSAGRSGSNSPAQSAHRSVHHSHGVYNGDGMYQASFSHTPRPAGHHLSAAAAAPPKFVLPGIYAEDAAIMRYYRMYTRYGAFDVLFLNYCSPTHFSPADHLNLFF